MGEKTGRVKVRKLICWDTEILIGEEKLHMQAKQNLHMQGKQRNSFTVSHDQVFSQPQEHRTPSCVAVAWEDNTISPNILFLHPPLLQLYMLIMAPRGLGYPLGQLGSAVSEVSQSNSLCTPSPLTGGIRSRKGIKSTWVLLTDNEIISVLSTLFSTQITKNKSLILVGRKLTLIPA